MTLSSAEDPSEQLVLEEGMVLARKYRLLRPAGFGGMAQLWAASNESTGAEVCIKVLVPERMDDEPVMRFRREANAAARLSHRAIVRTFDLLELDAKGDSKGQPVALGLVMELLQGETLGDLLMKREKLPIDEALEIAIPVCSALAHAHRGGIVHRDLKPDNIFLATDVDGEPMPKVLDFGISKVSTGSGNTAALTLEGVMLGTPAFMSPEQAKGAKNIDARSDVFSFGIVLYLMLTGKNPFDGARLHDVVTSILEHEPTQPAEIPDALWEVIHKALAKDPAQRHADATELGNALCKATGRSRMSEANIQLDGRPSSMSNVPVVAAARGTEGDEDEEPVVPQRKPPVKLVAGVLGGAAVIVVAALIRAAVSTPDEGTRHRTNATPTPTETATAPSSAPAPESVSAPSVAIPSATATASETAATTAPAVPTVRHVPTPTATTTATAIATTFDGEKTPPPPTPTKKPPPDPAKSSSTIIRDPGF